MVLWLGILVAAIFARLAIRLKFYEVWITLFNIIISIYLAIYLRPLIMNVIPATSDTPYGNALTILVTAIGIFLILYAIAYVLFISQFNISFPRIFNVLGSGVLGFLGGLLVWSFVIFLLSITPICQNRLVRKIGLVDQFKETNMPYIAWWCDLINTVASRKDEKYATAETINSLIESVEKKRRHRRTRQIEPNEPPEPNKPAEPKDEKPAPEKSKVILYESGT